MGLFVQSVYIASALSVVVVALLYRSHPFRRLPAVSVLLAFVAGICATIPVVVFGELLRFSELSNGCRLVFAGPALEEAAKLGLFLLTIWRLRFSDAVEATDFAIYFGILGVGFGIYEDLWYIFGATAPAWSAGSTARMREVLTTILYARIFPGHVLFGGISGFLWGRLRFSRRSRTATVLGGVAAFGVAFILHAGFNAISLAAQTPALVAYLVALLGLFLALRRQAASRSPFLALENYVRDPVQPWPYERPAVDYLFAEGYGWPGRPSGGWLQVYPIALSLAILFPLVLVGVYFVQRGILAVL